MSASLRTVFTLAIWLLASLPATAQAEPLRIFHFTWVGFGPLFVAQDRGSFAKEGI
jgi:NitT/TauT family transport system substrate-binding protein